ncbi:hypothetical protein C8J57DRAFT_1289464 [Mycena rebaudengoi]|nr:hypothetical protein C8J57DRAFT_1289464 [Mycena rebaudengoi]
MARWTQVRVDVRPDAATDISFLCSHHPRAMRNAHLSFLLVALLSHRAHAQTLVNGQTFTNGLAIIDAPAPQNPGHAGSTIPIAIDVSGNGKLPSAASLPGSGLSTSYTLLEIYLVSAQANINMTVSAGPGLLQSESGSTVKHLDWPIPACLPAADYNLTFYETSVVDSQPVFTITAVPIPISNPRPSSVECTNTTTTILNPLQPQPQASNPLVAGSPFLNGKLGDSGSALPAAGPSLMLLALLCILQVLLI